MTGGEYYRATVEAVIGRGHYFKAVRPDGSSFTDASFRYALGETAKAEGDGSELCDRGLLHFSDAPSATLAGGAWPCRLFEVASSAILASYRHKHGAKSLTVVRDIPAWIALGPNGRAAAAFIDLISTLDAAAWAAAGDAAWAAAWAAAWSAAWSAARFAAWDAAGDAARAIVVADLITPEQFAILYKPFAEVLPIERVREHGCKMWPMEGIR